MNADLRKRIAVANETWGLDPSTLPPELHQPHWDGLGNPHSWICQVCWGDGWQTLWPCEIATKHGKAVAEAGGLDFTW